MDTSKFVDYPLTERTRISYYPPPRISIYIPSSTHPATKSDTKLLNTIILKKTKMQGRKKTAETQQRNCSTRAQVAAHTLGGSGGLSGVVGGTGTGGGRTECGGGVAGCGRSGIGGMWSVDRW
ncbi:hypothetical protein A2U01_0014973 [Trifolium medium]|uniref:Uncharacterized protein n=1 Tax=Trifolium medium TaxID=97028 RepID=A0A392N4B4_9FABA|nr:hypothetical protein [Trifolium medium]